MEADAPLEILPLFVRAGSIVPFGPAIQSTAEARSTSTLQFRIYQGQDATFTLYEDEGDTYNYENGAFSTIELHWDEQREMSPYWEKARSLCRHAHDENVFSPPGQ